MVATKTAKGRKMGEKHGAEGDPEWAEREGRERFWDFNPTARPYAELHPPDWFSDRKLTAEEREAIRPGAGPETMRARSLAISMHQVSTCAGWRVRPTSDEFYEAIRVETHGAGTRHPGAVGTGDDLAHDLHGLGGRGLHDARARGRPAPGGAEPLPLFADAE